jgi:site-specific DNA-methyltransferase (adenine-specific)
LEVLKDLPDGCITAIVTDPPYGLEFMGKGWDKVLPPVEVWRECLRVLRPGGHALIFGGTRTYHRLACAVEDAGFEVRDCLMWLYGQGFPKSKNLDGTFEGWGTALKPAWEPILLARKPLIGTVERNCREHGTGALNIDGCRTDTKPRLTGTRNPEAGAGSGNCYTGSDGRKQMAYDLNPPTGRWPANLVLDQEAAAQLDAQTGELKAGVAVNRNRCGEKPNSIYGKFAESFGEDVGYGDTGGASRFFYCAKASKADRGEGNSHPTVKPVELMRWLVRLVKGPQDNLILDPFAGSGTTGVAAQIEDVPFILIEREAAYATIAESRLAE